MSDTKKKNGLEGLEKLLQEKEDFLNQHPELRPLQSHLDRIKKKNGNDSIKTVSEFIKLLDDIVQNELIVEVKELIEQIKSRTRH